MKQESRLRRLQGRLDILLSRNRPMTTAINRKICSINAQIKDANENIEAHITLIEETEDGTLQYPPYSA